MNNDTIEKFLFLWYSSTSPLNQRGPKDVFLSSSENSLSSRRKKILPTHPQEKIRHVVLQSLFNQIRSARIHKK
jgi:hypothetical protein